jgi:hypothetical protein
MLEPVTTLPLISNIITVTLNTITVTVNTIQGGERERGWAGEGKACWSL